MFTKSEQKIINKIKRTMSFSFGIKYMFWFIYDNDIAIDWEGGYDLIGEPKFRNQYTIEKGKKQIVKNW